jgi:glycosyltransferase involved in cell wall biosynthesis
VVLVEQLAITANYTLALASRLDQDDGSDVTVVLPSDCAAPSGGRIRIIRSFDGVFEGSMLIKAARYLRSLGRLHRLVRRERPDILHLQWFSLPWFEAFFVPLLKRYTRVVVTVHDVIPFRRRLFEVASLKRIYLKADAIIVHTETCRREFAEVYGERGDVFVVGQGMYVKSEAAKPERSISRELLAIPHEKVVFLFFGQVKPVKGLDLLIRAFGRVREQCPDAFLLVAGRFAHVDSTEYENLIDAHTTPENCRADFGFVADGDVPTYFAAADVLCLPYRRIFQSAVAQLGLQYEVPLIVSDVGEMSDLVASGENGLLVPSEDVDLLAGAMLQICGDRQLLARFTAGARHVDETAFSVEARARSTVLAYRAALARI